MRKMQLGLQRSNTDLSLQNLIHSQHLHQIMTHDELNTVRKQNMFGLINFFLLHISYFNPDVCAVHLDKH